MVLRAEATIVEQEVDDGLLLLRETGDYIVINRTGAVLWEMIKANNRQDDLVKAMLQLPGSPPREECERQAMLFLERLKGGGFLVEVG